MHVSRFMQSFEQPATSRRKVWSSAPPATTAPPKRSLLTITLIGAVWAAVGAASAAYVATRAHDAHPAAVTSDADR